MSDATPDDPASTAARLQEVTQRELWARAHFTAEILELKKTLKLRAEEADGLRDELRSRDTYIHELHLAAEAAQRAHQAALGERDHRVHDANLRAQSATDREREARADVEAFTWLLAQAEEKADELSKQLSTIKATRSWRWSSMLRGIEKRFFAPTKTPSAKPSSPVAEAAPGRFTYYLHTSPFRRYRAPTATVHGWLVVDGGKTAFRSLRARIDDAEFTAINGRPDEELAKHYPGQPGAATGAFEVTFATPPGRHRLSLDAEVDGRWWCFFSAPIWVENPRA